MSFLDRMPSYNSAFCKFYKTSAGGRRWDFPCHSETALYVSTSGAKPEQVIKQDRSNILVNHLKKKFYLHFNISSKRTWRGRPRWKRTRSKTVTIALIGNLIGFLEMIPVDVSTELFKTYCLPKSMKDGANNQRNSGRLTIDYACRPSFRPSPWAETDGNNLQLIFCAADARETRTTGFESDVCVGIKYRIK